MDYTLCSMMFKGRVKKRINLENFYKLLDRKYSADYNPEMTNRVIVHLDEASILFFSSGTIQVYLKKPEKKQETIEEINRMLLLIDATHTPNF